MHFTASEPMTEKTEKLIEQAEKEVATGSRKVVGGGFRLQEKAGQPLTPEYLNKLAESKYND